MFNKKSSIPVVPKVIAETRFYTLEIYDNKNEMVKCYSITNKEHGVIEATTEMLPQALTYLEELDTALAAAYDSYHESEYTPVTLH